MLLLPKLLCLRGRMITDWKIKMLTCDLVGICFILCDLQDPTFDTCEMKGEKGQ